MSRNDNVMRTSGSTEVSKDLMQQNAQLQGVGFEIFGEQEFVRYPVIGVNQPTSEYRPEGKFHNRVTGDVYDSIDIVFLALRRSMTYRPNGYSDQLPTCFSSNALRPDPAVEQPIHHMCHKVGPRGLMAECPNAQWIRTDGKARRACDLKYTAAIDLDGKHYLFYLQGKSIKPLEVFLSQLRQLRQPLFGMRINLGLTYRTKKEGYLGNFYELDFPDLTNQSQKDRWQAVNAMELQEPANFFKEYFDIAPSDLYHEGADDIKDQPVLTEGVRFENNNPQQPNQPNQQNPQSDGQSYPPRNNTQEDWGRREEF